MIDVFESSVRINPESVFFTFIDEENVETAFTYRFTRLVAAALARRLQYLGVRAGEVVAVDLPNSPEFVFFALACAYGGFTLMPLNHQASSSEKLSRIMEAQRGGLRVACQIDTERARQLVGRARQAFADECDVIASIVGNLRRERAIMGARQDLVHDTVHFAERAAHLFSGNTREGIIVTAGVKSRAKLVMLSWVKLAAASRALSRALENDMAAWQDRATQGSLTAIGGSAQLWQLCTPMYNIDGFQTLVRAVYSMCPLRIYAHFDPEQILYDVHTSGATHICVYDQMLQDLLTVEEWRLELDSSVKSRLSAYRCVLLANRTVNPHTIERSCEVNARIFVSYGMAETAGSIACACATSDFRGALRLLDGYDVRIIDEQPTGFGSLAVRGHGVFNGYIGANTAFTADRYFITGDIAAFSEGCIYVKNRSMSIFMNGGASIYPAEIAEVLLHVPGVTAAHVFAVEAQGADYVPVAVVECPDNSCSLDFIRNTMSPWLSPQSIPQEMLIVHNMPRKSDGRIDRQAAEAAFNSRLQVCEIHMHHVRIEMTQPISRHRFREAVIIEVVDSCGRRGLGECPSLAVEWVGRKSLAEDTKAIRDVLAPCLLENTFSHPREAYAAMAALPGARNAPMALNALENAMWDLYGHVTKQPLWQLINKEYARIWESFGTLAQLSSFPRVAEVQGSQVMVSAGAVIETAPTPVVMQNATQAVRAGYKRLKIKISPDGGLASVHAVRRAFPDMLITLDANRSFRNDQVKELHQLDSLNIGWIEEPFDVSGASTKLRRDHLANLAFMQSKLDTPLCVDEAYSDAKQANRILQFPDIRCIAIKVAKFGGITPALAFIAHAKSKGCVVWMGGMHDTGIMRRVSAAFETLPDMVIPGDIGSTSRYLTCDITTPPYAATRGLVLLNGDGFEYGLGCTLNRSVLSQVEVNSIVLRL
ncbi:AMP-binding protein [Adlercreutzia sp. ZJ304]|uniref:AMP-binding protein n=1 Tax=Adlercreutzia sp. ZJ304 TaxID=2709791 RepID=UPI0013EC43F6|nr:AMP-binding protein [Adlercreutzia sp. ZJ304]